MAQSGYTPISIYYSSTATNIPTAGNLTNGELAINIADGKLYYKDSGGTVQVLATKASASNTFSAGSTGLTPSTATTGAVTLAGTLNVSSGGTGATTLTGYVYGNGTGAMTASTTIPTSSLSGTINLATQVTGTLPVGNGGTGLTTLTAGYIPYGNGTGAFSSSANMTFSSPTLTLSYSDNTFASGLQVTNSNAGSSAQAKISLTNSSGNTLALIQNSAAVSSGVAYVGTSSTQALTLGIGYAESMRIDSSGNVGIGTSSPTQKLCVNGASIFGSPQTFYVGDDGGSLGAFLNQTASLPMRFNTAGTEAMRIDSSGNVGIGLSSGFTSKFNLYSSATNLLLSQLTGVAETYNPNASSSKYTYVAAGTQQLWGQTGNSLSNTANLIDINVFTSAGATDVYFGAVAGTASNGPANFVIGRRTAATSWAESLRIDTNGNVGIGTTAPLQPLQVTRTSNSDTVVARLENVPITASNTSSAYLAFNSNPGNGSNNTLAAGGIYGKFDGNSYTAARLTLCSVSASDVFVDVLSIKNGNVGIGTTSPTVKLDINGPLDPTTGIGIRLAATTSGANSKIQYTDAATYNWTAGTTGNAFTISNGEYPGTAGTERMRLDTSGNLLVGTTSTNPNPGWFVNPSGYMALGNNAAASGFTFVYFGRSGTGIGSISQVGTTAILYNTTSDYRLKENVAPIQNALATVEALNPVSFTWVDGRNDDGFLAHEIQAIIPNCVTGEKDAVNEDGTPKYQQMDNSGVIPFLVKAIQEQQALITDLQARLTKAGL